MLGGELSEGAQSGGKRKKKTTTTTKNPKSAGAACACKTREGVVGGRGRGMGLEEGDSIISNNKECHIKGKKEKRKKKNSARRMKSGLEPRGILTRVTFYQFN